jgi:8-oxo-dGTP diphosphatase
MMNSACMTLSRVAGGIVWRETSAEPRIAVVHRARRKDWSLPKGRLDAGETWLEAARREVAEETGCDVRIGRFAGAKLYVDRPEPKLVLYWHMRAIRQGVPVTDGEVDEVAWLSRREALSRLDHGSDRRLLLRALKEGPFHAGQVRPPAGAPSRFGPDWLRTLVVVDSDEAENDVRSYLGLISKIVGSDGRRAQTSRA